MSQKARRTSCKKSNKNNQSEHKHRFDFARKLTGVFPDSSEIGTTCKCLLCRRKRRIAQRYLTRTHHAFVLLWWHRMCSKPVVFSCNGYFERWLRKNRIWWMVGWLMVCRRRSQNYIRLFKLHYLKLFHESLYKFFA